VCHVGYAKPVLSASQRAYTKARGLTLLKRGKEMNRDDIIRIYSQVSDELCGGTEWCWAGVGEPLQRFANLVAAAEREACAKVVEEWLHGEWHNQGVVATTMIRARGQV